MSSLSVKLVAVGPTDQKSQLISWKVGVCLLTSGLEMSREWNKSPGVVFVAIFENLPPTIDSRESARDVNGTEYCRLNSRTRYTHPGQTALSGIMSGS